MLTKDQAASPSVRTIETPDDLDEARLEATGYIFHGALPKPDVKQGAIKAGTNLLHFARCGKLDKIGNSEDKIWFRTIGIAKDHLDSVVGPDHWKWCKLCVKEVTQKIINER